MVSRIVETRKMEDWPSSLRGEKARKREGLPDSRQFLLIQHATPIVKRVSLELLKGKSSMGGNSGGHGGGT